ncbi:MAG: DUF4468 domain-containing protein [Bacteroidales bacterium]
MKKLLLIFVFTLTISSCYAQAFEIIKVIQADSISASNLYGIAKDWIVHSFPSPQKVIQVDDPTRNYIACKGTIDYSKGFMTYAAYTGYVDYTLIIEARDGRIRVQITNVCHRNIPPGSASCSLGLILETDKQFTKGSLKGFNNNVCKDIKIRIIKLAQDVFPSIEDYIKSPTSSHNEEW